LALVELINHGYSLDLDLVLAAKMHLINHQFLPLFSSVFDLASFLPSLHPLTQACFKVA
jgi:hypothetical protein